MGERETQVTTCTICRYPTDDRDPVRHQRCAERLTADLRAIPGHYALMGAVLAPGTAGGGAHVSGTRTAPLPVRLEPLSLRAKGGMVTMMASWEAEWRDLRGMTAAERGISERDLAAIVLWLRAHLPWAIESHPAVEEFAGELRDILHQCRMAAGVLPKMTRIGDCPNVVDGEEDECGVALYADPRGDAIRCRRCRSRWHRGRWMLLGETLRGEEETAEPEGERLSA
jgi:hypothetical protein